MHEFYRALAMHAAVYVSLLLGGAVFMGMPIFLVFRLSLGMPKLILMYFD